MSSRSFAKAVQKKLEPEKAYPPVVFDLTSYEEIDEADGGVPLENGRGGPLVNEDGTQIVGKIKKQLVLTATKPSDDAVLYSLVQAGRTDASSADRAAFVYDFFRDALRPSQYAALMKRVRDKDDEVDTAMLTEIYEWLTEQWTDDFPTNEPSESSPQQALTGTSSTGRSRSKRASTPSAT